MATTEDGGRESVTAANRWKTGFGNTRVPATSWGDHPGMVLVSAPFDGTDFLAWRRSMVIALRAKRKLGFIDGRYSMPDKTSDSYENWIRMDSMVMSWILNAISKKISKAFLYTKSSRQLWLDLEESYDSIRNQILIMDPFPSVNKAYAMVLCIERQRMINAQIGENVDNVALHTKWNDSRSNTGSRGVLQNLNKGGYKGKGLIDKRTQICTNCGKTGHTKDTCFKLHGGSRLVQRYEGTETRGNRSCKSKIPYKLTLNTETTLQDLEPKDTLAVGRVIGGLYILDKTSFNPTYIQRHPSLPVIQHIKSVKASGSDNGSEFVNFSCHDFFQSLGIIHQKSCPHTPQQNEIVEQKHQHLLNMASHITHSPTSYSLNPAIDSTSYTHPTSAPVDSITPTPAPIVPETPTLSLSPTHTPVLRRSQRQPCTHVVFGSGDAVQEPRSFTEANRSSHWREAMEKELEALEKNSTWDLIELPAGKKAIGSRWVYKTKLNQDGSIERYKARLVAKGYTQIEDVNNAFLHGYLEEEVYMVPPEGYSKAHGGLVCRLKRSLYGLKQASRQWNVEFTTKLESYGFKQCPHDHCLFTLKKDSLFLALIVYVDDVLLTGNSLPALDDVKHYLDDLFTIKDWRKYLLDIVHDCHLDDAKATATPLPAGIKFDASSGPCLTSPEQYRRLVGRLLYLGFSRPDISFAVQQLSQFIQCPRQPHWDAALYLVCYLKGSSTLGLFFAANSSFPLIAYSDSDWASCLDIRRSVTGYCIFLGASLISWKTKKQATVSRSSAEAEYRSMGSTVCELLWIGYILAEFGISLDSPIPFHCDNKAAIHITENPVFHERTKHLDIDCHLVRDQFKRGFILPQHVSSQHQPADLFTKSLPASPFARLVSKLGMLSHAPT
ncbi:UNVERIFIED_CONTAM: Retrovirus-related Pol polyprotein from transposon RE2 [Sesamum latifolium]|uniref:Retrovirus-related Pol polyprotein from transposon RE2 n=1 Tax=Sesamum latifolium TaxID=2727402 RepID=A0AAW2U1Z7_9LAMI